MTSRHIHTPVAAQSHLMDTVSLIEDAERLGYDHAWVPETWGRDAITTLAMAAGTINTIGLGTSIVNVYARSPAVLGQTAATLAESTPGPFRLGIGPSGPALVNNWHGIEYERPLRRTRETTEIIKAVLSGDIVEYDGDIFQIEGFRLRFDPPEDAVPIDLAGLGPKSVELAGFIGDGWHGLLATPSGLEDQLDHLRRGAGKRDRSLDDIDVTVSITCCALEDGETARELAAGHIAFYTGAMGPFYAKALARQGYEDLARQVVQKWQGGDREGAIQAVKSDLLDDIAVAGTPGEAIDRLSRFEAVEGVDAVAVSFPRGATRSQINETVESLAPSPS